MAAFADSNICLDSCSCTLNRGFNVVYGRLSMADDCRRFRFLKGVFSLILFFLPLDLSTEGLLDIIRLDIMLDCFLQNQNYTIYRRLADFAFQNENQIALTRKNATNNTRIVQSECDQYSIVYQQCSNGNPIQSFNAHFW